MEQTTNMNLYKWDELDDPYDHTQLAANWEAVDDHDHSSGRGVQIDTAGIKDNAIATAKIQNSAVTSSKIATDGVHTSNIQNSAVTADKLDQSLFASILPLGTVLPWYRPPGSSATTPTGFVLCVGGTT